MDVTLQHIAMLRDIWSIHSMNADQRDNVRDNVMDELIVNCFIEPIGPDKTSRTLELHQLQLTDIGAELLSMVTHNAALRKVLEVLSTDAAQAVRTRYVNTLVNEVTGVLLQHKDAVGVLEPCPFCKKPSKVEGKLVEVDGESDDPAEYEIETFSLGCTNTKCIGYRMIKDWSIEGLPWAIESWNHKRK